MSPFLTSLFSSTSILEIFPGVGHSFANYPGAASERCVERMRAFIARCLVRPRASL